MKLPERIVNKFQTVVPNGFSPFKLNQSLAGLD
jgi:hypothetical protein